MKFAVIGSPIAHSKSPAMHTAAYRALGLPHSYEALDVSEKNLPEFLRSLKRGDFQGISVTVPHKVRAFELADERAPSTVAVGAANTLVVDADGKITAHNTDARALHDELAAHGVARGCRALVIGSGGAARAAIVALRDLGAQTIRVLARNVDSARALNVITPLEIAALFGSPQFDFDVFVQATSAGMTGADDGEVVASCIDWARVSKNALAYDVIYSPRETAFLHAAKKSSIAAENGLGMLVRQGAIAFELWLGIAPPLDVMRRAIDY
ncbi:MAG: shikimate dehydrogenase [Polyangiaceae bacterium]